MRRKQLWGSQPVGVTLLLGDSGHDGALFSRIWALYLGMEWQGRDVEKIQAVQDSQKAFPHLWALPVQIRKGLM